MAETQRLQPSPEALNQLIERGTAALVRSGATAADLAALPAEFQEMIDAFPDRAHRIAAAALVRSGATPEAIALLPPELQRLIAKLKGAGRQTGGNNNEGAFDDGVESKTSGTTSATTASN